MTMSINKCMYQIQKKNASATCRNRLSFRLGGNPTGISGSSCSINDAACVVCGTGTGLGFFEMMWSGLVADRANVFRLAIRVTCVFSALFV